MRLVFQYCDLSEGESPIQTCFPPLLTQPEAIFARSLSAVTSPRGSETCAPRTRALRFGNHRVQKKASEPSFSLDSFSESIETMFQSTRTICA